MTQEIKVPPVGESISTVTVGQWLKKDGDFVQVDEILCELESDKSGFEVVSEFAGVLSIKAQEGEDLPIGGLLCTIATDASAQSNPVQNTQKEEVKVVENQPTGEIFDVVLPPLGESILEATLESWLVNEGDFVNQGDNIAEIGSDKANLELPTEKSGHITFLVQAGDTIKVGQKVAQIAVSTGTQTQQTSTVQQTTASHTTQGSDKNTYATGHTSPAATKILSEKGINPADVKGTGVDGRITKEDALKAEKKAPLPSKQPEKQTQAPAQQLSAERTARRERMSSMRRTISRRLVAVKNETAMLTTFNEADMSAIMAMRAKYKDIFKEKFGVNLGFMSFFSKACALALLEFPAVNAMIDGDEMIFHNYVDISIAVSTPKGLVVPVVRDVHNMSLDQIEAEIRNLSLKARDGKLTIPEMTGGTFTITNGGVFGSMMSTPIINAPQSAILGMHNIVQRPIAVNGQVEIRPMMYLALSYDHRIIDGKDSVSFLVRVKEFLEAPERMFLGV